MNARLFIFRKLALALSLATITPAAIAHQCGDISPRLLELGDQYYELDNTPKSELFEHSIEPNDLIETLQSDRFRGGEGQRTRCFGVTAIEQRIRHVVLKSIEPARVNGFNEIVLNAYEYDSERKTAHRETVFIPLSNRRITLTGKDGINVNTRHRQPINRHANTNIRGNINNAKTVNGAHLREISMTVNSRDDGIDITQLIYINGHLAEWFNWKLES